MRNTENSWFPRNSPSPSSSHEKNRSRCSSREYCDEPSPHFFTESSSKTLHWLHFGTPGALRLHLFSSQVLSCSRGKAFNFTFLVLNSKKCTSFIRWGCRWWTHWIQNYLSYFHLIKMKHNFVSSASIICIPMAFVRHTNACTSRLATPHVSKTLRKDSIVCVTSFCGPPRGAKRTETWDCLNSPFLCSLCKCSAPAVAKLSTLPVILWKKYTWSWTPFSRCFLYSLDPDVHMLPPSASPRCVRHLRGVSPASTWQLLSFWDEALRAPPRLASQRPWILRVGRVFPLQKRPLPSKTCQCTSRSMVFSAEILPCQFPQQQFSASVFPKKP